MATLPATAKENGEETTPIQNRRIPPPKSVGRSFGTPLSNCSSVPTRSVTTSKKVQLRQSSEASSSSNSFSSVSKKIVRARKLVQQHRTPTAETSKLFSSLSFASPSTDTPNADNTTSAFTYVATFLPGPMGVQLEPSVGKLGCQVFCFADGGTEQPGQARQSNQIQPGDTVLEINDEAVSHESYDKIVDRLKALGKMPRKIRFRRPGSAATAPQTAPPKPIRTFNLNSQGALTPVVSPPREEEGMSNEKKSVSSNLFSTEIPGTETTPNAKTSNMSAGSATLSPSPPKSPTYTLLPQDSIASGQSANIVLDINDDSKNQSIDTSSTISPSKVKNLSQEDIELGLGQSIRFDGNANPNGSMAMVLRNVYNRVGKKAAVFGTSILSAKLGNQERSSESSLPAASPDRSSNRSPPAVLEDGGLVAGEEDKEDAIVLYPTEMGNENYQKARDDLHRAQDEESKRFEELEKQLTEANDQAHARQNSLISKQEEMTRRLQEAREEADERIHQMSQMQLATQTDLEHKLQESNSELEMKMQAFHDLERDLQEANHKVSTLLAEKEDSEATLETIRQQLKDLEATRDDQKSTHLETKLQVAQLQTMLRDEKKETERLKSDVATSRKSTEDAESKLKEKQEELDGTTCIMEAYEERFMEREKDVDVLMEEKDFAGRELAFARSEVQRLSLSLQDREGEFKLLQGSLQQRVTDFSNLKEKERELSSTTETLQAQLQERDTELASTRIQMFELQGALEASKKELDHQAERTEDTIRSLRESAEMASKELEDKQQQNYDRERELQAQVARMANELQQAADKRRTLEDSLKKRDADLKELNSAIDSKFADWNDAVAALETTKTENEKLMQEQDKSTEQAKEQALALSKLQAIVSSRDGELERNSKEIKCLQHANELLEKEAKESKEAANGIFQEKSRLTKELNTLKFDISDLRVKATKTADGLLQRARHMDQKAKDAQSQLKKKENDELVLTQRLDRAQQKIQSLSADLEQKESALESSTSEIKSLEETNDNLRRRESQLKVDLEEKEREKLAAQAELRDSKGGLFEASSRISFLERQINELETTKKIVEKEGCALKNQIASLNEKVESQRESLDKKSWELSTKSMEVMNLETTVESQREELNLKIEELEGAETALATAKAQYAQLNECFLKSSEQATTKIQGLTADLISAQDEVADHVKINSKFERQVASMKQQVDVAEDQLCELRAHLTAKTEKSDLLSAALDAQRNERETKEAELQEEIEKHRALTKKLEKECQERTNDNAALGVEMANLEQMLASSRASVASEILKHKKECAELVEAVLSQKQAVSNLQSELGEATSEQEQLQKQLKDMEIRHKDELLIIHNSATSKDTKLSELLNERDSAAKAISNYQEELSLAKLEIQRIEESRKRSRDEIASLTSLIETMQSDHTSQQNSVITKHADEIEKLTEEKEQVDSSIRKLMDQKLAMQKRIQDLETRVEEERNQKEILSMELDGVTHSLHRAEDMVADLSCQLNILKEQADQSLDESIDSQTLALSKHELRLKCKYMATEMTEVENRAASNSSAIVQKKQHIRRLEEGVKELTDELDLMVTSCSDLEAALLKARMDKANADADAEALRDSILAQSEKTEALKQELQSCESENLELLDRARDLKQQLKESGEREECIAQKLEQARETQQLLKEENDEGRNEIVRISQELATANQKRESALTRVGDLQSEIAKLEEKLETAEKEKGLLKSESQSVEERFEQQLREMRNESGCLRAKIASLDADIENQLKTIRLLEENKIDEQEKLESARKYGLKMEQSREEAVAKLTEASRVLAAQKGIISVHETRAIEAERKSAKLSNEVSTLKDSIQTLQSATEESRTLRSSHLEELEKQRVLLEKAKVAARAEAETLRDDLRSAQRKASELDRINKAQGTRINELKSSAETTKAHLRETRGAWAESENLSRSLENAVQQSKADNDSLRAKLTLTGATISRLKSDRALLQEALHQTKSNSKTKGDSDAEAVAKELNQIKAMLLAKEQEVSTHKLNIRNLKKMLSGMKTSEVELVSFIESILVKATATFKELTMLTNALEQLHPSNEVTSGDAASPETPEKVFAEAKCCLGKIVSCIKEASGALEEKRQHLDGWKSAGSLHMATPKGKATTPAALLTPTASATMRSFRKLRELIVENSTSPEHAQQVQAVITSLEGQIDSLCAELKSAHMSLAAKDKANEQIPKLHAIQESNNMTEGKELMKTAGVKSLAKFLHNQKKTEAASGLRQWSNAAASMHAADQQKHAAEALSATLEATREKLVKLKVQHKRSKASSG